MVAKKSVYDQIVVVATSQEAGTEYAETLGLENYVVVTELARAQGRRMKAYVVTPAYIYTAESAMWKAREVESAIIQSATLTNAPLG